MHPRDDVQRGPVSAIVGVNRSIEGGGKDNKDTKDTKDALTSRSPSALRGQSDDWLANTRATIVSSPLVFQGLKARTSLAHGNAVGRGVYM